jgi:hypothetical protein
MSYGKLGFGSRIRIKNTLTCGVIKVGRAGKVCPLETAVAVSSGLSGTAAAAAAAAGPGASCGRKGAATGGRLTVDTGTVGILQQHIRYNLPVPTLYYTTGTVILNKKDVQAVLGSQSHIIVVEPDPKRIAMRPRHRSFCSTQGFKKIPLFKINF